MTKPTSIEAYAIVSADGMLADSNRQIPKSMQIEADQKFFHFIHDPRPQSLIGKVKTMFQAKAVVIQSNPKYLGKPHEHEHVQSDRKRVILKNRSQSEIPQGAIPTCG